MGDKLLMAMKKNKFSKSTNISEDQKKIIAERKERLGVALRENLKRRKISKK
ncbi:hypothetical protein OAJ93_01995 [Gammaproteobacteria bacterium]|nr:hypothetical protein [Gammaproteobacteria bacterium]